MTAMTVDLEAEMADLESAEDFLEFFGVEFQPDVVRVNRLHILQRFHDYMNRWSELNTPATPSFADYSSYLARAYDDFVHSDPLTEKVFSVFKRAAGIQTVPLSAIGRARKS